MSSRSAVLSALSMRGQAGPAGPDLDRDIRTERAAIHGASRVTSGPRPPDIAAANP
jgi:hypothetical protein